MEIILKDYTRAEVSDEDLDAWKAAYPNLNVPDMISRIAAWCHSNPDKRWTAKGWRRGVNTWLARESDKQTTLAAKNENGAAPEKRGYERDGIPDYGNYRCHWELAERIIEALWDGREFVAPDHLKDYRTYFPLAKTCREIVEGVKKQGDGISFAFGILNKSLRDKWSRQFRST